MVAVPTQRLELDLLVDTAEPSVDVVVASDRLWQTVAWLAEASIPTTDFANPKNYYDSFVAIVAIVTNAAITSITVVIEGLAADSSCSVLA